MFGTLIETSVLTLQIKGEQEKRMDPADVMLHIAEFAVIALLIIGLAVWIVCTASQPPRPIDTTKTIISPRRAIKQPLPEGEISFGMWCFYILMIMISGGLPGMLIMTCAFVKRDQARAYRKAHGLP
jgi:hypothetical protein